MSEINERRPTLLMDREVGIRVRTPSMIGGEAK